MHWLVFGDDWGRHPSTTQHLVRHLPPGDRISWVDSLGMRAPRLSRADLRRVRGRLGPSAPDPRLTHHLRPRLLPWHTNPLAQRLNRHLSHWPDADVTLVTNPIAALYLEAPKRLVYLRLDDWPTFAGVDARFIAAAEPALLARADLVVAPNAQLLEGVARPTLLLPQGVDLDHFGRLPLDPPRTKVVGFWGGLSAWLDQDLITRAAEQHPDWTFELIGKPEVPLTLFAPNIHLRGPIPYAELPSVTAHWRGAWLPYRLTPATRGMSPLKLREYLAAGLPTASTDLPEARALGVDIIEATTIGAWLTSLAADTASTRAARRQTVARDGWSDRAATLRAAVRK